MIENAFSLSALVPTFWENVPMTPEKKDHLPSVSTHLFGVYGGKEQIMQSVSAR